MYISYITPAPKVAALPVQIFIHSKSLAMACANFTIIMPIGLTGAFRPVLGRKSNLLPNHLRFGGLPHTCHCHSYAFPCKRWLDFFDWRINQRQVFGWYWSNFEHCSLLPKFKPIWSSSQRGRWATHPLLGFIKKKNCAISRQTVYINLSASRCGWSHPGHWRFKKKSLLLQKSAKYSLLVQQRPRPPIFCLQLPCPPSQYFQRPRLPRIFLFA